jgi:hypothetical protein
MITMNSSRAAVAAFAVALAVLLIVLGLADLAAYHLAGLPILVVW